MSLFYDSEALIRARIENTRRLIEEHDAAMRAARDAAHDKGTASPADLLSATRMMMEREHALKELRMLMDRQRALSEAHAMERMRELEGSMLYGMLRKVSERARMPVLHTDGVNHWIEA